MKLERKHAVLFLGIAAWNVLTYANFAKNLADGASGGEDRPTGYYIAHITLIVVNVAIAVVLAALGWKAWKAAPQDSSAERVPR